IWREVTSSSETRLGANCPHYDQCFVTRMRRDAEAAQLVIVNHHLFFADLALRGPHPGSVIPDYEAVIFDEAHQLEDVATDFFGVRISGARIERLLADFERTLGRAELTDPLLGGARTLSVLAGVSSALEALWRALDLQVGRSEPRVTLERD